MIAGISGKDVPDTLPLGAIVNDACEGAFSPPLCYAIAWRETLSVMPPEQATLFVSGDGGHGIMQLTSVFPGDWRNPEANIVYAIEYFLLPAQTRFIAAGLTGDPLIMLIAAAYNAGPDTAWAAHLAGDVDSVTTNHYAAGVLGFYHNLLTTGRPA